MCYYVCRAHDVMTSVNKPSPIRNQISAILVVYILSSPYYGLYDYGHIQWSDTWRSKDTLDLHE